MGLLTEKVIGDLDNKDVRGIVVVSNDWREFKRELKIDLSVALYKKLENMVLFSHLFYRPTCSGYQIQLVSWLAF